MTRHWPPPPDPLTNYSGFIGHQTLKPSPTSSVNTRILSTGKIALGAIGPKNHIDDKAIGSTINITARLQAYIKDGEVIVSESTFKGLEDQIDLQNIREINVKGVDRALRVTDIHGVKETSDS